jgi:ABC-2 type transport system permease protein
MRRVRFRTFVRSFTHGSGTQQFQYVVWAVFGLIAFSLLFSFSSGFFALLSRSQDGARVPALVLSGLCNTGIFLLVFVGLAAALYTMYLSDDVEVLAALPLRQRTIFAYRFWETLLGDSVLFVALGLPVLLAYGVGSGASVLFYPVVLVVSVLLLMVPTGLCVLLIMPLMRLLPSGKAREIAVALGALVGTGIWAVFYLSNPPGAGSSAVPSLRTFAEVPVLRLPPGSWAADALVGAATLDFGLLLGGLLPLALLSSGVYALCLGLAPWAYATGWARAAESSGRVRSRGWVGRACAPLPRDVRAVFVKDMLSIPRDLRRLVGVVTASVMGVTFAVINAAPASELSELGGGASSGVGLLALSPYAIAGVFAALGASWTPTHAVGGEGRAYWWFAASPLSPGRLLLGKWIGAFCVVVATTLISAVGVSVLVGPNVVGLGVVLVVGLGVGALLSAYSVGIMALFPRFDWENPNQITSGLWGLFTFLVVIGLSLLAGLAVLLALALLARLLPLWLSLALCGALWMACAAVPAYLVAGAAHLSRMDWVL